MKDDDFDRDIRKVGRLMAFGAFGMLLFYLALIAGACLIVKAVFF